ncbi:MAG: phospholipid transport system substrate-binding protein [Desulfovibrionales bacterium]|jgi:phospholipid transport system substrate-binding protein|nr:phospholipid transport system substrate-binding protein [Desulfovibrionales bacterium]
MRNASLFFAALLLGVAMLSASSASADEAQQALEPSITEILSILADPQYKDSSKAGEQKERLEKVILDMVDFKLFTALAMGKAAWIQFSPEQQNRLVDAFTQIMENKYLDNIRKYTNEKVEYLREDVSPNGNKARIETAIVGAKSGQVPVTYSLYKNRKTGRWLVYDLTVEGISMLSNWRTQFAEAMKKMSPNELVERMEKQARGEEDVFPEQAPAARESR